MSVAFYAIGLNVKLGPDATYMMEPPWWEGWDEEERKVKIHQVACPCSIGDEFSEQLKSVAKICPLCSNVGLIPDKGSTKRLIESAQSKKLMLKMADYNFVKVAIDDPKWRDSMIAQAAGNKAHGLAMFVETQDRTYNAVKIKASVRDPAVLVVGVPSKEGLKEWEQGKQGVFAIVPIPKLKVKRQHIDEMIRQAREFIERLDAAAQTQLIDLDEIIEMMSGGIRFLQQYDRIQRGLDPDTGISFLPTEEPEAPKAELKRCSSRTRGVQCTHEPKVWDAKGKGWCKTHAHKRGLLKG